jgi:hypothetical protein
MKTKGPIDGGVVRRRRCCRVAAAVLTLSALLAVGLFSACKTSTEAANAATQLTHVSQQLSDYYAGLSSQMDDTITLNQIQAELLGVPFDDSDHNRLNTTKQELDKRAAMANSLGTLATAYAALAGAKSATDIGNAASDLAKECVGLTALPGGAAIPDVVAQAGQQLVELVRAHKLQQSSEAISRTVAAIDTLFESEVPVYESINKQRIVLAQSLALLLVQKDLVDVSPLLAPALKPFGLTSKLPPNQTPAEFRHLAEVNIRASGDSQISAYQKSTEALANSLKSVSKQVEAVAKKR